ncbi:MAG TPA: DoxX family membrane protein [Planctomycetaceae bacterium]|nr:DoxX family membrane protein [Planctomycetaceae bacterium]
MKIATHVARYFLGVVFLVFGLNGFVQFIQVPPMPPAAGEFLGAMVKTGYLMTLVKLTEVACGALLLAGVYVPLALVLLSPVVLNIFLFHTFLTPPKDAIGAVIFLAVQVFLLWQYRTAYRPLFVPRATIGS